MNTFDPYQFDVVVVGAGHAGAEAAMVAARLGARTALLTMSCDTIGAMSCNPAIGGVAKGQIVREIDALGGIMGQVIDKTGIQFRMLNSGKGPAMHSPRAQADKKAYQHTVKHLVEQQDRLSVRQELVEGLVTDGKRVTGVRVKGGTVYHAPSVVLTTGTFLQAIMHTGETKSEGGRAGEKAATGLSAELLRLGFELQRFKTGTPARINGRTIDFSKCTAQPGDDVPQPFSYMTESIIQPQMDCHLTMTTPDVHRLIEENLHRAPMYSGQIDSTGPRYCPSIEDKIVRFADKSSHQIFLEPEGRDTLEYYCNGISTSLPRDVQDKMIRLIPGLENADIMRFGYAVEYDFAPPTQLHQTLETRIVNGLYFAGQLNGTTGYEEAAGQGFLAGANAALKVQERQSLILDRSQAYLGVLIDDLVSKGVDEPYRMFTSRAEYRMLLRQDNADRRLTPVGQRFGTITNQRQTDFEAYEEDVVRGLEAVRHHRHQGQSLEDWLKRPEIGWNDAVKMCPELSELNLSKRCQRHLEIEIQYSGYIKRQEIEIAKLQKVDNVTIPMGFDYASATQLRHEAREKLARTSPTTVGQASRVSGITPSDVAVLMIYLKAGHEHTNQFNI